MPESINTLLAVYVDGETKTGKGSASQAIASLLKQKGLKVYYDVAGDFYRRFTALVRAELGLAESDALSEGKELEEATIAVYNSGQLFAPSSVLGDLQRPSISKSVSILGELPLAQKAGAEWWARTLRQSHELTADVLVVDGRNPRLRMQKASEKVGLGIATALDLYMQCSPEEAARRALLAAGVGAPTPAQLAAESAHVADRRNRDRTRTDTPFVVPEISVKFLPGQISAEEAVRLSWQNNNGVELPTSITLDNTHLTKPEMLVAVLELAAAAVIEYPG